MLHVERERECVQALGHSERVYMAGLALAGWRFSIESYAAPRDTWVGRGGPGHELHAPSLFSLLGYIERVLADEAAQKLLPDAAKSAPSA